MRIIKPPHPSSGHYSAGIISNGMLYISGQTSADPETGRIPDGGIAAEAAMCLSRAENILKAAGIDKNCVVMCRVFVSDMSLWGAMNEAYAKFFGAHMPARAVYESAHIHHGANVEMEAVAEMPR